MAMLKYRDPATGQFVPVTVDSVGAPGPAGPPGPEGPIGPPGTVAQQAWWNATFLPAFGNSRVRVRYTNQAQQAVLLSGQIAYVNVADIPVYFSQSSDVGVGVIPDGERLFIAAALNTTGQPTTSYGMVRVDEFGRLWVSASGPGVRTVYLDGAVCPVL